MMTTRTQSSGPDRSAFRRRMRVLSACLGVGFAVVAGRLFQLQVVRAEHYRDLARKGLTTQRLEPASRGAIVDRFGRPLAKDQPSFDLAVRCGQVPLQGIAWAEIIGLRERFAAASREARRAMSPAERRGLERAYQAARARLAGEPWVRSLARCVRRSEDEIAAGLVEACDHIARGWAHQGTALTILRDLDEPTWTAVRALQEDAFRNPKRKKHPAPVPLSISAQPEPARAEPSFPGLVCTFSVRRVYPHGAFLAHVLGTLGELDDAQMRQLAQSGELLDHLEPRRQVWTRHRARLSAEQAGALREILGADPRTFAEVAELLSALRRLPPPARRKAAELGLRDEVRWAEQPPRVRLCEAERIAFGVDEGAEVRRIQRALGDRRIGETGLERQYNEWLRGKEGLVTDSEDDPFYLPGAQPQDGGVLALTISTSWQSAVERVLEAKAQPAAMVVLDCHSGEVLALASFPDFDPNLFSPPREGEERLRALRALLSDPGKPLTNRACSDQYPLGSVMKALIALAALETGKVGAHETFHCGGSIREGGRSYGCDGGHRHGSVDLVEALRRSCNVCFYQLGARVGVERLAPWAHAIGFGRRTGLDLPNEAAGVYPGRAWRERRFPAGSWDRGWSRGKDFHLAIGQGYFMATPLQAACLMAAIANGGHAVTPRLRLGGDAEPPRSLGASPQALALVRQGLDEVVNVGTPGARGTAYRPFHGGESLAIRVAGKTGTADTGREGEAPHAWFAGYAPSQQPRIAFCVFVEHGGHGGEAAGPMAYEVLKEIYGTRSAPVENPGGPAGEAIE